MYMKFNDYISEMANTNCLDQYAINAGTTANYLKTHLICSPPRKIPRKKLLKSLAEASEGNVSFQEVLDHFYKSKTTASA